MKKLIVFFVCLVCIGSVVSCTTFHASLEGLEKADIVIEKKAD